MRHAFVLALAAGLMAGSAAHAEPGQGNNRGYVVGKGGVARAAADGSGNTAQTPPAVERDAAAVTPPRDAASGLPTGKRIRGAKAPTGTGMNDIGVNEPGVNRAAAGPGNGPASARTGTADPSAPF